MKNRLLPLLGLLLPVGAGWAQDKTPYVVPRFVGQFRLDGIPDEPGWLALPALPATMCMPTNGTAPSERTEFRVAFDDDFIYAAGWFYDRDPKGGQGYTFKRDDFGSGDWFGLHLDTFADKENALVFYTTPTGNRCDAANSNDAQGENFSWVGASWNTFWYCATSRTAEGWFAEFKIPLSSLRYQERDGRVVMGMSLNRRIARKNEYDSYPAISNQWGFISVFKASQAQPVVFEGLRSKTPVYVTPYLLAGLGSTAQLTDGAYQLQHTPTYSAGLDVKVGLTSNLTADLTINTDFAQVEADDQQANLTRFSLFYPEKRLFFQERASIFNFGFGTNNQLFYSRRIGLTNGQRVPILAGGRVVGRVGRWDVGLLDMQTRAITNADGAQQPSENMSVLRLRRRVFNANSYVGAMTTARLGTDGRYNVAYGLDGIFRVVKQNFLAINWAQTFKSSPAERGSARWRVQYEKRILKGFGFDLSAARVGAGYDPGLGFESRQNYTRFGDRLFWGWLPGAASRLLNHQISLYGYVFLQNGSGLTESVEVSPTWEARSKKGQLAQGKWRNSYENLTAPLALFDEASLPAGHYRFQSVYGLFATPDNQPLNARFEAEGGQFYDGSRLTASVKPTWILSRYLELGGFLQENRVWFPTRGQRYDVVIAQVRTRLSLNVKLSVEGLVQYNSAAHRTSANLRFRYNPREGNDFFVVFNQGTNTDRFRAEPILPPLSDRTVILKYSYTFVR